MNFSHDGGRLAQKSVVMTMLMILNPDDDRRFSGFSPGNCSGASSFCPYFYFLFP